MVMVVLRANIKGFKKGNAVRYTCISYVHYGKQIITSMTTFSNQGKAEMYGYSK